LQLKSRHRNPKIVIATEKIVIAAEKCPHATQT
jgi:hypothetical protein